MFFQTLSKKEFKFDIYNFPKGLLSSSHKKLIANYEESAVELILQCNNHKLQIASGKVGIIKLIDGAYDGILTTEGEHTHNQLIIV